MLIAVIGTTQLQMTEASRILYAFARDRLLPGFLGRISERHQTPWVALTILGLIPPIFLIPDLVSSSFFTVITHIISSGGELYLFMYFVVAVSSVWFYRSQLTKSGRSMVLGGILPLIGGGLMLVLCIYGMTTEAGVVTAVTLGILALTYIGAFIIVRTATDSPFLEELQRRRAAGISGPEDEADGSPTRRGQRMRDRQARSRGRGGRRADHEGSGHMAEVRYLWAATTTCSQTSRRARLSSSTPPATS